MASRTSIRLKQCADIISKCLNPSISTSYINHSQFHQSNIIHACNSIRGFCSKNPSASIASKEQQTNEKDEVHSNPLAEKLESIQKNTSDQHKQHFINHIMVENKKWCDEHGLNEFNDGLNYHHFLDKQTPLSTMLSCCDSRAPTSALGSDAPNDVFSVRNIGNQFCNSIGSFRYGIEELKTPYAIIMGHTNCGAIRGAASDYRGLHTMVQQEVISLVRVIRFADSLPNSTKLDEMPFDHRCNVYAEINVDYQINRLLDDYQINEKVHDGKLTLIGMMFDVHNVYNKGYGRVHLVNINGDRDVLSLRQHPLLTKVRENIDEINGNGVDELANFDIATRLFSYSSNAAQSSRFSNL